MAMGSDRWTLADRLEAFFDAHRGEWLDGRQLATVAGAYAWRTRVSDLRKPPYLMQITNRRRRVMENGRTWAVSEYCYQPVTQESTCDLT